VRRPAAGIPAGGTAWAWSGPLGFDAIAVGSGGPPWVPGVVGPLALWVMVSWSGVWARLVGRGGPGWASGPGRLGVFGEGLAEPVPGQGVQAVTDQELQLLLGDLLGVGEAECGQSGAVPVSGWGAFLGVIPGQGCGQVPVPVPGHHSAQQVGDAFPGVHDMHGHRHGVSAAPGVGVWSWMGWPICKMCGPLMIPSDTRPGVGGGGWCGIVQSVVRGRAG
jgi:hypothetical protein